MKLIIILREPISRAYSSFNMGKQKGKFSKINLDDDILKFFAKQENDKLTDKNSNDTYSHIVRGFYDEILEYILSKFSRDNLYIGISEEINQNKLKYYNEIYEFLGATKLKKIIDTLNTHVGEYTKKNT